MKKNVYGLENAMKVVESACEKGEITIIGEGRLPSPVELYNKCVAYINKQYGVDILNLVSQTAMRKECGDCCCDCSIKAEDAYCYFNLLCVSEYLDEVIPELMSYLEDEAIEKVIECINDYCDEVNSDKDSPSEAIIEENITDIIYDAIENISYNTCKKVAESVKNGIMQFYFVTAN